MGALRAIKPPSGCDDSDTVQRVRAHLRSADFGFPPVTLPISWVSPKTRKEVRPFIDLAAFSGLTHLPLTLPPKK